MTNLEKYNQIFIEGLYIGKDELNSELKYRSIETWDSVRHMKIISDLEDVFEIMIEPEDIVAFSGYDRGKEILNKYGIQIN